MKSSLLVFALVLVLPACSGGETAVKNDTAAEHAPKPAAPPPPDATRAAEVIAASPEFGDYQFTQAAWSLPISIGQMNEPARVTARQLAKAGWISMTGDSVVLNDKAKSDRRFLVRSNGFIDIVPLAKKQLLKVTAMSPQPEGGVSATFTWQWVPNDIASGIGAGELKERYEGERQAEAALMWDGTAWTVLRITKK